MGISVSEERTRWPKISDLFFEIKEFPHSAKKTTPVSLAVDDTAGKMREHNPFLFPAR
jgi:hypothetical protein